MSTPPDVQNPPAYQDTEPPTYPPQQRQNGKHGYMHVPLQEPHPQQGLDSDSDFGGKDTMELLPPSAPRPQVISRAAVAKADKYLLWAVLVTFCCFAPFGIIAIIKAMDVKNRLSAGDAEGAKDALKAAKKWTISAVVGGILSILITFAILLGYISALIGYFKSMIPSQEFNGQF